MFNITLSRRRIPNNIGLAMLLAVAGWTPVAAQAEAPSLSEPPNPTFLSAFRFHVFGGALAQSDPRFRWSARIGGDLDVV